MLEVQHVHTWAAVNCFVVELQERTAAAGFTLWISSSGNSKQCQAAAMISLKS
jgi:hypothetical protein